MRPVQHGDVSAAARALLAAPAGARPGLMQRMLVEAEAADRYRRRFRRSHAAWGNGTLMASALSRPAAPEPRLDDKDYLDCQHLVIEALLQRATRAAHPRAQEMQRSTVGSSSSRRVSISSPQSAQ